MAAAQDQTVEETIRSFKERSGIDFRGELSAQYTDNLFHYSDERLDDFDDEKGSNERFDDLEEPWDVITRLRLGMSYTHELGKKRNLKLSLDGSHYLHQQNDIADYSVLGAEIRVDVTRKNRLTSGVEYTPDRFKKNYLDRRDGLSPVYGPAEYEQLDLAFGYERRFTKSFSGGLVYRMRDRSYNDSFEDRDQDGDYAAAYASYRLTKRVDGMTELSVGQVDTGLGEDLGVPIDRSYDQTMLAQEFEIKSRGGVRFGLAAEYRRREFTTDEKADTARFDRTDDRLRARLKAEIPLGDVFSLTLRAGWTDNDSLREEAGTEPDETGYEEIEGGLGLKVRF
jgi:hypothetical protein